MHSKKEINKFMDIIELREKDRKKEKDQLGCEWPSSFDVLNGFQLN